MAEPFGLFHFLERLLAQNNASEPFTPPSAPPSESEPLSADTLEPTNTNEPAAPNACLSFLQAHDARAKNLRKK